ncbi:unknown protein [Seminavis robusta]|uniref:Uncharacterized protein n=1 Tax=Seminavis robusta TaxID=568900 RepID=A0A9N8H8I6_9STRA|nr:unknown protein [Seminavis robusta]|eukprot:Sro170_g075500.1 n/a (381) ;mRNA; r:67422-68564
MIAWWDTYLSHTHPDQVSFYAYPMTEKERQKENAAMKLRDIEYNAQNPHDPKPIIDYDIWYKPANVSMNRHPGNIGHNAITSQFKKLCALIGVQNAEIAGTGQAIRAKACTVMKGQNVDPHVVAKFMRHKNINTQGEYNEHSAVHDASRFAAIAKSTVGDNKKRKSPPETTTNPDRSTGTSTIQRAPSTEEYPPQYSIGRTMGYSHEECRGGPVMMPVGRSAVPLPHQGSFGNGLSESERQELEYLRSQQMMAMNPERMELERLRRQSYVAPRTAYPVSSAVPPRRNFGHGLHFAHEGFASLVDPRGLYKAEMGVFREQVLFATQYVPRQPSALTPQGNGVMVMGSSPDEDEIDDQKMPALGGSMGGHGGSSGGWNGPSW